MIKNQTINLNQAKIFLGLFFLLFFISPTYAQEQPSSFDQGMELYYQKRWADCLEFFNEAIQQGEQNSMALFFYLSASYHTNNLVGAVNDLERQSMKDDNPLNKSYVGIGYFARGLIDTSMMEEAKRQFGEALSANPDLPIANTGMGVVYYEKRLIPRAKAYFMKALKGNDKDLLAMEKLGEILMMDEKNPRDALVFFEKMIQISPRYCDGYFLAGSAYERLGEGDKAVEYFKKTMELDPLGVLQGYNAPIRLGDYYLKASQFDMAEEYYKKALAVNPENPYVKTQMEKAKSKGKEWKGEKVDPLKNKVNVESKENPGGGGLGPQF